MADPATVGVVVPVHGFAPLLAEALDGILAQDPSPDQVVVVDDGSPEPLALHPDHAGRCELVRLPRRRGAGGARAAGIERLATELVAFCDADDAWAAGKLAAQLALLDRHAAAAACFGHARIVGLDGRPTGEAWDEPAAGVHAAGAIVVDVYERNPLCTSSALVRRVALDAAGGLDPTLERAEDLDLWLRLLREGAPLAFEPRAVVRYRRHPGALTADVVELARALLAVQERHAGLVDEDTGRRAQARTLEALADGLAAERRHEEARAALARARALCRPTPRARVRAAALAVPGVRRGLGRRDPYRR